MSDNPLERLFSRKDERPKPSGAPALPPDEVKARAELAQEAAEPKGYRACIIRARPVLGFAVIEKDGTAHGFSFHTLRHPKHQVRDGNEYLSFTADALAVVIEGKGLAVIFRALLRHTLAELREHDGTKHSDDPATHISRLGVVDPRTMDDDTRAGLL